MAGGSGEERGEGEGGGGGEPLAGSRSPSRKTLTCPWLGIDESREWPRAAADCESLPIADSTLDHGCLVAGRPASRLLILGTYSAYSPKVSSPAPGPLGRRRGCYDPGPSANHQAGIKWPVGKVPCWEGLDLVDTRQAGGGAAARGWYVMRPNAEGRVCDSARHTTTSVVMSAKTVGASRGSGGIGGHVETIGG